ncbi:MAG: sigma-54-dependent Fis family transcriptional regulator, partial [Planctomycetaceae bacterium]|nr:sigma-54-dependent Fis family transcriptional regulator [Planctomycetaceae bacterium]
KLITAAELPPNLTKLAPAAAVTAPGHAAAGAAPAQAGMSSLVGLTMEQIEREVIRLTLAHNEGNRERTAKMLAIGERTLYRKIKEYGL